MSLKAPQTGDNSHMALWLSLLGISGIGAAAILLMRKRKNKRQGGGQIGRPFFYGKEKFFGVNQQ